MDEIDKSKPSDAENSDFSKGSIARAILRLTLPLTLAQLINITYSVVDRIYLGNLPGAEHLALTGVGLTFPVIFIIMSVASLCGTGGGPLFAIARGKGEDEEAERIMGNAFTMLLFFGVILTAFVITFRKPILYLFGASDDTYPYAGDFLMFYSAGSIFVMISLGMNPFINAQGFGRIGMLTVALGAIVNLIIDPIFIFALGMGVRGAGLANVIAQFCSAVWVMLFLTGKKTLLRVRLSSMKLQIKRVRRILSLGFAGFCMNLTTSLTQIVCNVTLQRHGGDLYVGIMAVINSLRDVISMPITGMSSGAVPVLGYNYGAGEPERVRKAIKFFVIVTAVYAALMEALLMLVPGPLIRVFNNDPDFIATGVPALRIYFSLFVFMSLQLSTQNVFLGLGKSKHAIFFTLLRKAMLAAPLTIILPLLGMGTNGVFIAEATSQFIGGVACFSTMFIVVYRRLGVRDSDLAQGAVTE